MCRFDTCVIDQAEDLQGVNRRHCQPTEAQVFARFDHQFSRCVAVVTALAFVDRILLDVLPPSRCENDNIVIGYADPQRSTTPPASSVDARIGLKREPRLGVVYFISQKLVFEFIQGVVIVDECIPALMRKSSGHFEFVTAVSEVPAVTVRGLRSLLQ